MPRRMREALERAEAEAAAGVLNSAATQDTLPPRSNVLVLFGSQTGCAEEVRRFAPHAVGHTHWGTPHDPAATTRVPARRWRSRSSRSSRASTCHQSACRSTSTM